MSLDAAWYIVGAVLASPNRLESRWKLQDGSSYAGALARRLPQPRYTLIGSCRKTRKDDYQEGTLVEPLSNLNKDIPISSLESSTTSFHPPTLQIQVVPPNLEAGQAGPHVPQVSQEADHKDPMLYFNADNKLTSVSLILPLTRPL